MGNSLKGSQKFESYYSMKLKEVILPQNSRGLTMAQTIPNMRLDHFYSAI